MLQFVVRQEGWLVRRVVLGRGRGQAPQRLDVGHRHPQDGQLVRLPGQSVARWHHVRQLGDVGGHLVPPPALDLAVVLTGVLVLALCQREADFFWVRLSYSFNANFNLLIVSRCA